LKRRESKKSLSFPELGFAVSVEESMKDGTFTVLLGLRDRLPNYTAPDSRSVFGATSWGKIQTEHPSFRVWSSFGQITWCWIKHPRGRLVIERSNDVRFQKLAAPAPKKQ
jgi:hypothetical protein